MPTFLPSHHLRCNKNRGQILIDILIATAVFAILIHAIFSLVVAIYESIGYTRTRLAARHLATEKMEQYINLPYNDLGTTTGIPHGTIQEFETFERGGLPFTVHTSITYVDDPFDQTAPNDLLPNDYKQIRIEVTWEGEFSSRSKSVVLLGTVAPRGIETSTGGGTLAVFVINALGQPVAEARVEIVNTTVSPEVNMTLQTNADGYVILPAAPPCATCYHITVSKPHFTTDKTYTTSEVANPNKRPVTVSAGQLSEATFVIDRVSTMQIHSHNSRELSFTSLPFAQFRLTGSKTIGTDSNGDPVYRLDSMFTTNSEGILTIEDLEWDAYIISIPPTENSDISGIYPHQPISLNPGEDLSVNFSLATHTPNSLLFSIKDASGSAIASASAVIVRPPSFTASSSAGMTGNPDFGQMFFPDLTAGLYSFTLTHPDFNTLTGEVTVDETTTDALVMTPKE